MFKFKKIYHFYESKDSFSPIILSSPHSGRFYPKEYIDLLNFNLRDIRIFEDCYVDKIYDFGPSIGCNLLASNIPRVIIDLNRGTKEIDREMFFNLQNISPKTNKRVASGIGIFPKLRGEDNIYKEKQDWLVFKNLINDVYDVWHSKLENEINEIKTIFSEIVIIDCHSMPSFDLNGKKLENLPEFVIGNLWGKSSNNEITQFIVNFLKKEGFIVSENLPYAGAHILKKYGRPETGISAIQIEIRKDLYLDEEKLIFNKSNNKIKRILKNMIFNLSEFIIDKNMYQKSAE